MRKLQAKSLPRQGRKSQGLLERPENPSTTAQSRAQFEDCLVTEWPQISRLESEPTEPESFRRAEVTSPNVSFVNILTTVVTLSPFLGESLTETFVVFILLRATQREHPLFSKPHNTFLSQSQRKHYFKGVFPKP